jgi:hypothetical protein
MLDIGGAPRQAWSIAQHEPCVAVAQDQLDRARRQFPADRDHYQPGAHDAEKSGEILAAIGGQDRDALARAEAAGGEPARSRVGDFVEFVIAVKAHSRPAQIDQRRCFGIALPVNRVAEIGEPHTLVILRHPLTP